MTVGSWCGGPPPLPWNAIDTACSPVDGVLHLLIPEDRHYSSVAGVAPAGTDVVKPFWRVGKNRAEAWNADGDVLDEATP